VRYDVRYPKTGATEKGVTVDRIISLADAQQRGIAKTAYDVSGQAGVEQMLEAHNQWRKRSNVPALTWSPQLASYAQEWANKLLKENRFEHRRNSPYGENLAAAQGQQLSPERVVNMWGEEVKDYNYANNSCKPGAMCGHYTQVVWKSSTQVGCAVARASGKEVWVCNYNPPGNVVGRKPY
jgi:pathogenesis-related protein 1